ncbi:hypothetical protein H0E87_016949 [Populus deltoides]|uniref:FAR1 domain-containing protein n=1 Tax=Populus deltoides TaxID=3696 RepID=A0A8T2XYE8_POPDE|nr:hypothetical protein H0E87_016949 [Populus deltoides]
MDVHVIDDEEGTSHRGVAYNGDAEPNDSGEANNGEHDEDGAAELHEPCAGMEFDSENAAKTFYDEYARRLGFSTKVAHFTRPKTDGAIAAREFVCGREGLKRRSADSCHAMLRIELKRGKWVVTHFVKEHNHSTVNPNKVHYLRPRRHFAGAAKSAAKTGQGVGVSPSGDGQAVVVATSGFSQGGGVVPSGVMYLSMDGNRTPVSETNHGVRNTTPAEPNRVVKTSTAGGGTGNDDWKTSTSASDTTPFLWPLQDEVTRRFNLNDTGNPVQSVADLNLPRMAPVSLQRDDGPPGNMAVLPCLKSMTWVMENKSSTPGNRVAVINLKLQDYGKTPSTELEVKFQLSRVTLEPMLRSMAYISEQLSTPANRVAVINLKLQDTETTTGESEVKFQVSRDTLGAMLRSMAYIREQLSISVEPQAEPPSKKHRK